MPRRPPPDTLPPLALTLLRLRQRRCWSRADVAARLGVHRTAVYAWERGQNYPTLPQLEKIAHLYGVSASSLLAIPKKSQEKSTESAK